MHWLEKLLLPPSCQLCGNSAENDELCAHCAQAVTIIGAACTLCALPNDDHSVCAVCGDQPPHWQSARSCFAYDGTIRQLMQRWKYGKQRSAERLLCEAFEQWLSQTTTDELATAIIPVPMHQNKLRQRGFNTAYSLAQAAQKALALPILDGALLRPYMTHSQAGLDKTARQQNLMGAFDVDVSARLAHRHVILIDDVYTTGATASICTQLLHNTGVSSVHLITLARALPPSQARSP